MIRRNLLKAFALGLCISSLWAGTAYAQSGGGSSAAFSGTVNAEDPALYEKQRELDQILFIDHVEEIENSGFKIIYTGVADKYVEVGIAPYSDENAKILYELTGNDLVKVVNAEVAVVYAVPEDAPDYNADADIRITSSPMVDIGMDTPVSANASDEILMQEEKAEDMAVEEELKIQIESFDGIEEDAVINEADEETGVPVAAEDMAKRTDIVLTARDDVKTVSVKDDENEMKNLSVPGMVSVIAGGIAVLGGAAVAIKKKKSAGNN